MARLRTPGHAGATAPRALAQSAGCERWYRAYRVRVCRVEREYGFEGA